MCGATCRAHLVVPSARAVRVGALVSRIHIDQHAAVPVEVDGALAVASAAEAGKCDALASEAALQAGAGLRAGEEGGNGDDRGEAGSHGKISKLREGEAE